MIGKGGGRLDDIGLLSSAEHSHELTLPAFIAVAILSFFHSFSGTSASVMNRLRLSLPLHEQYTAWWWRPLPTRSPKCHPLHILMLRNAKVVC